MKTAKSIWGAVRLCILGLIGSFNVGASMGAKQGVITAPTGADSNLVTLGAVQPVRDTLMGIARAALQLASALKVAIVNFGVRKVVIADAGVSVAGVEGAANTAVIGMFTLDDPSKRTGPWTFEPAALDVPVETLLAAIIATRKPSFSVESLGNAIEDLHDGEAATMGAKKLSVIVDQATGEVRVLRALTEADAAVQHAAALAVDEDAQYIQTLDAGGGQFGE